MTAFLFSGPSPAGGEGRFVSRVRDFDNKPSSSVRVARDHARATPLANHAITAEISHLPAG